MTASKPVKVLIIDDNVALAENIAEILEIAGHLTSVAGTAEAALAMVQESIPDVVVTDYRLPGISGLEFVKRFRARQVSFNAIVISAYTDDQTKSDARDLGATFIAKPVDLGVLTRL